MVLKHSTLLDCLTNILCIASNRHFHTPRELSNVFRMFAMDQGLNLTDRRCGCHHEWPCVLTNKYSHLENDCCLDDLEKNNKNISSTALDYRFQLGSQIILLYIYTYVHQASIVQGALRHDGPTNRKPIKEFLFEISVYLKSNQTMLGAETNTDIGKMKKKLHV